MWIRDWIVIVGDVGNLVNDTVGAGGFEFFGPFTESEARHLRGDDEKVICVQLLKIPRTLGEHWNPEYPPRV